MRFSLKWALAANGYVALAATAIATRHGVITAALWCTAILAVLFALRDCFNESARRGPAFGFVLGAATYISLACAVPSIVPPFQYRALPLERLTWSDMLGHANAIGVVVAGLLGVVLGAVAFRTGPRD